MRAMRFGIANSIARPAWPACWPAEKTASANWPARSGRSSYGIATAAIAHWPCRCDDWTTKRRKGVQKQVDARNSSCESGGLDRSVHAPGCFETKGLSMNTEDIALIVDEPINGHFYWILQ